MKTFNLYSNKTCGPLRLVRSACQAFALVALIGTSWTPAVCRAEEPAVPAQGEQVLTRGPVHEAFAGTISFNPEPGIIVAKAPPEVITEVPPGERPVGNNITWIPGYWAWDEERSDFLWVSGTWRALPPGRQWIAGYWGETTKGYQWTSGYWADAAAKETTYLPAPPATVETGPNIEAPSADYRWTPGNWMWNQGSYAWGPGYWARGRADWDWTPSHYVWTPRGYVYVDGYWDYPVSRRGSLFAPVYFRSAAYSHSGYSYTPAILLDLAIFAEALFVRPSYHHYYFGDYYDNSYHNGGYYSAYAYQSNRYGYDPVYSHQRWSHRQDQGWDSRIGASYQYRRDNVDARPPRTWDAQRAIATNSEFKQNRMLVASPIDQMAKRKDGSVQFQTVTKVQANIQAKAGSADHQPGADKGKDLPEPRKTSVTPRDKQALPEPREKLVQPEPRQPVAEPRKKTVQPEPRQPAAVSHERQPQPALRQPAVAPRNQPAAKGTAPHDSGAGQTNEKDRKKKGKE